MNQSKLGSAVESIVNILIGCGVALGSQYIIFPQFGIHVSHSTHLWITFWFTVISFVRSYFVRRWFNKGWFENWRAKRVDTPAAEAYKAAGFSNHRVGETPLGEQGSEHTTDIQFRNDRRRASLLAEIGEELGDTGRSPGCGCDGCCGGAGDCGCGSVCIYGDN